MDELPLPDPPSAQGLAASRALGEIVHRVLVRTGLPASWQPDFREPPASGPGARIGVEPTVPGRVNVRWTTSAELVGASIEESRAGDFTGPAVRLNVGAAHAMGEAIVEILRASGLDAGLGVDLDPATVWVTRPS